MRSAKAERIFCFFADRGKKVRKKKAVQSKKILENFLKKRHFFTQILPFFGRKSNFF